MSTAIPHEETSHPGKAALDSNKRSYRQRELAALADLPGRMDKKFSTGPQWNMLYKTRLCANYQTTGQCPYFQKCQFAHGENELARWEAWRVKHFGKPAHAPATAPAPTATPATTTPVKEEAISPKSPGSDTDEPLSVVSPLASPLMVPGHTYDNVSQILHAPLLFDCDLLHNLQL